MIVYVFDASALLRFTDQEAGADQVERMFREMATSAARGCISAVQWGEIAGNLAKRFDIDTQRNIQRGLVDLGVEVVPASGERAVKAAVLRAFEKLSYANAFAVELALDSPDHILVTADCGFKVVEGAIRIEFLPAK